VIRFRFRSSIAVSRSRPRPAASEKIRHSPSFASTATPHASRRSTHPHGPSASPPGGTIGKSTATPCSFHTVISRRPTSTSHPRLCAHPGPSPASRPAIFELYIRRSSSGSGPGSSRSVIGCVNALPVTTSTGCDAYPHSGCFWKSGAPRASAAAFSPPPPAPAPAPPPPPPGPLPLPPPPSPPPARTATLGHMPGIGGMFGTGAVRAIPAWYADPRLSCTPHYSDRTSN
jgi:hypothetical protein